ncbi:hypothetical protein H7H82_04585 [Mycobacterium heidelbergense]|nr:hypothetical protein [Mycobacterium heidelbergense]MCV7049888.1 hypothetical protein [Mycobacterium heidelbergense]
MRIGVASCDDRIGVHPLAQPGTPEVELRLEQRQALAASWMRRLLGEAGFDVSQASMSPEHPFIIGPQNGLHVTVAPVDSPPWIDAKSSDQECQAEVDAIVERSAELSFGALTDEDDFGGVIWYTCTLADEEPNLAEAMFFSRMQQMLYTPARVVGWLRLGAGVLLNFREDDSNLPEGAPAGGTVLFHPRVFIDVYIAVPGPADGPLTAPIARQFAEVVAAICTFALGRPINLPPMIMPLLEIHGVTVDELDGRRKDTQLLTLARQGIALDAIFDLPVADKDSWLRIRGALLSYDAALRQQREQVAIILFVAAAECLTNPFQPWKKDRLTTRFVKFFGELMPDHLDQMVQHGNFEQAFGVTRGSKSAKTLRRILLERVYDFRSEPVHEGLAMAYEGFAHSAVTGQRRMLAAWFAEYAILYYLEAPRTSLIGHPVTAPNPPTD